MWPNNIYSDSYLWICFFIFEIQILTGVFAGLAIIFYFYRKKLRENRIAKVRYGNELLKQYKLKLILISMATDDKYSAIKDLVLDIKSNFRDFRIETRKDIKEIRESIQDYIRENNDRVAKLEKNDAVMNARITMYVGVGLYIVTTIINFVF